MGGYTNGEWPESMFIVYDEGVDEDGPWKHLVTAGTQYKINRLKELAYKRTKRRLEISPGWSCYRPIGPQRTYRARYGNGAAYPATSSHGINWLDGDRGWRVCLAIDIHNWGWVYGWDRDAWYADCRKAGFAPGLIHPSRGHGYPDEPWHIIDLEPFKTPPQPVEKPVEQEDEEMSKNVMFHTTDAKYTYRCGIGNDVSGLWIEWVVNDSAFNNKMAAQYGTGPSQSVSPSMFNAIRASHAATRPQSNLAVTVGEETA